VNDDIVVTMISVLLLISWSCANTISVMCTDVWITVFYDCVCDADHESAIHYYYHDKKNRLSKYRC